MLWFRKETVPWPLKSRNLPTFLLLCGSRTVLLLRTLAHIYGTPTVLNPRLEKSKVRLWVFTSVFGSCAQLASPIIQLQQLWCMIFRTVTALLEHLLESLVPPMEVANIHQLSSSLLLTSSRLMLRRSQVSRVYWGCQVSNTKLLGCERCYHLGT